MAEFPVKLSIVYSSESLDDLDLIWEWNAREHGVKHANRFREFL